MENKIMMLKMSTVALATAFALGPVMAQAFGNATSGAAVSSTRPVYTQSMQRLQDAADRLRKSIQALAEKPPGPDRERAIGEAHDALLRTQQAMLALPPELRSSGTVTADYDESVRKLMKSADSLRQSIQEMAQQPAGERRDRAIQQANRALWDTQSAMVAAYQPGTSTKASGAAPADAKSSGAAPAETGGSAAAKDAQGDRKVSRSALSPNPAAVLVLLPAAQAQGNTLANGCWVRFFDDKQFKGDTLTLAGPVDLPRMELGDAWRDWDSAVVGPKATVRTFDNENFRDRTAVLGAGQSIPDLRDRKLGWFEEVKSARVMCG